MMKLWFLASALTLPLFAAPAAYSATLTERFSDLSCAVVHIDTGAGSGGTGFFIDDHGTVLTAAHVVMNHSYELHNGQYSPQVNFKVSITVVQKNGKETALSLREPDPNEVILSSYDLAELNTGLQSRCPAAERPKTPAFGPLRGWRKSEISR